MSLATQMVTDLTTFLSTSEFAVEATIGAATVNVILDEPFNATDAYGRQIENADVSIVGAVADIGTVAQGTAVVIGATTYYAIGAPQNVADALFCRLKLSLTAQHG